MLINILAYPGMTMLDAIGPYEVLSRLPGVRLQFVARSMEPIRADTGFFSFLPACELGAAGRSELLLVPGGPPQKVMAVAQDAVVGEWLRGQHEHSRFTASVCTGALILIGAGIIREGAVSTHWEAADAVAGMGLSYTGKRISRSGKVFTAAGVSAGIDLALALVAAIADVDTARAIQVGIEYDPQPPFAWGGEEPQVRARAHELLEASMARD